MASSVGSASLSPSLPLSQQELQAQITAIDDQLSKRDLELDPAGYFIIYLDVEHHLICAKYFSTIINEQGLATDPATGEVIPARGKVNRTAEQVFTGRTAKELCVKLFEKLGEGDPQHAVVSQFSHAAYLGREFQKAEAALMAGIPYVQD